MLISKKKVVTTYGDLRPINFSTFTKKIISKLDHMIIVEVLFDIISQNQSKFVIGRSIIENVLLA